MNISLRSFVESTLSEIVYGIEDARRKIEAQGFSSDLVNPELSSYPGRSSVGAGLVRTHDHPGKDPDKPGRYAQFVKFDVAIQVTEEAAGDVSGVAGFQIGVVSLKAGADKSAKEAHAYTSRVEFHVPLRLSQRR